MVFEGLDEVDNKILNLLKDNARMSYSDIGDEVGLTRVAAKNRIKSLEEKDIIRGYHAEINPISAPGVMPFYAYIETKPDMYEAVVARFNNEPMVSLLFKMSGNNALLMICAAESKDDRANFAWQVRNSYEGITYFTTKDIWEVVKGSILPD